MPAATRLNDPCTGHGCFPPRTNIAASADVIINGQGAHREGDGWGSHCCGPSCHAGTTASGSPNVFVNGKAKARIGDPLDCGSAIAAGSANVFLNEEGGRSAAAINQALSNI
ncbi:PAAR domain-containing protein [Thiomicrorhabdus sp.]|uniref:PAAR domain-containing protein n=1 Tax=Thiomicrorhabdus sp. TaxID=2039724 RepID=UPI003B641400